MGKRQKNKSGNNFMYENLCKKMQNQQGWSRMEGEVTGVCLEKISLCFRTQALEKKSKGKKYEMHS